MTDGLLAINKPEGWTSHDVVGKVRGLLSRAWGTKVRVGHTGTLDPFATGVLLLCVGQATRLADFIVLEHKTYDATVRLGTTTDTLDRTGRVLQCQPLREDLTMDMLGGVVRSFRGPIRQRVPAYSAIKVQGKRLYQYARAGEEQERPERDVEIYDIDIVSWQSPDIRLKVSCSKGTYIRSLAEALGDKLGVGGHLAELCRLTVGDYDLSHCTTMPELEIQLARADACLPIQPLAQMLSDVRTMEVFGDEERRLSHGNALVFPGARLERTGQFPGKFLKLVASGQLIAIGEVSELAGNSFKIQPKIVMAVERALGVS